MLLQRGPRSELPPNNVEGVPVGRVFRNRLEWGSLVAFLHERHSSFFHGLIPTSNRNTQSSAVSCSSVGFSPGGAIRPTASFLSTESTEAPSGSRFNLHSSSKVISFSESSRTRLVNFSRPSRLQIDYALPRLVPSFYFALTNVCVYADSAAWTTVQSPTHSVKYEAKAVRRDVSPS